MRILLYNTVHKVRLFIILGFIQEPYRAHLRTPGNTPYRKVGQKISNPNHTITRNATYSHATKNVIYILRWITIKYDNSSKQYKIGNHNTPTLNNGMPTSKKAANFQILLYSPNTKPFLNLPNISTNKDLSKMVNIISLICHNNHQRDIKTRANPFKVHYKNMCKSLLHEPSLGQLSLIKYKLREHTSHNNQILTSLHKHAKMIYASNAVEINIRFMKWGE